MSKVKNGDTVKVHYTGKFEDGEVFDSSIDREPLEFTVGAQMVIPGFESAVLDKEVGEKINTEIEAKDAYGERIEELQFEVSKDLLPKDYEPKVGDTLQVPGENGQAVPVTLSQINDETIVLDGNHPLAGKKLIFDIELVEIK